MRTPAQMTFDVNALNGNSVNGTHNPVTVAQMEAIYAEARKIEWTDKKPDRGGKWFFRNRLPTKMGKPIILTVAMANGEPVVGKFKIRCCTFGGQWSTRPIDMPAEKEEGK